MINIHSLESYPLVANHRISKMSPSTYFVIAVVPLLVMWCGVVDGNPFGLGLLALLGNSNSNNSNLLTSLATAKLQAKIAKLTVLSDLIQIITNSTG